MEDIKKNLDVIRGEIAETAQQCGRSADDVLLVAVSKTRTPEEINVAIDAGVTDIGENKVQEAAWKQPLAVSGPEWHLIGHLQKNKVRPALALFSTFHSIDSIGLIDRLQLLADEMGARPRILLEVNMSGERSKDGMRPEDVPAAVERALAAPNLTLEGFMTMAPFTPTDKIEETRPVFAGLRELRDAMEAAFGVSLPRLSMGMSNDYRIAVEEGATWIRLGTVLFGARPKVKPMRPVDAGDAGESGEGGGTYDRVMD